MSFYGLLNKKCSWSRRINVGSNDFGEIIFTEVLVASDIPCSRQVGAGNNDNQLLEGLKEGDLARKISRFYFAYSDDVQEGDIITFETSDQGIVRSIKDDAGRSHHKKALVVEISNVGERDKTSG